MSNLTINPELNWSNFPNTQESVLAQFNGHQTIILAKIPKGVDEDFNQNGIYFGLIDNPDGDYNGLFFATSHWNGSQDCYFRAEIRTEGSSYIDELEPNTIYPITTGLRIEDISEYVIVERMKI